MSHLNHSLLICIATVLEIIYNTVDRFSIRLQLYNCRVHFENMHCNRKSGFPSDSGKEAAVKLCGGREQTALLQAAFTESLADCYVPRLIHRHTA